MSRPIFWAQAQLAPWLTSSGVGMDLSACLVWMRETTAFYAVGEIAAPSLHAFPWSSAGSYSWDCGPGTMVTKTKTQPQSYRSTIPSRGTSSQGPKVRHLAEKKHRSPAPLNYVP
uniref:Uncharacterized protein n=1 Tax=Coccidioides posadasii RMSCC 3488 TaxID=454284 RepID=A0A0J6FEU5_COCPO|nr:hypothetical protein CPAG_04118 [Coccidioides posadasii RMSCC 3488]